MALVRIPETYVGSLGKIIVLPDNSRKELLSALSELPPTLDARGITSRVTASVKSLSEDAVRAIVRLLISLYSVRVYSESPVDEFVEDLCTGMEQSRHKELRLSKEQRDPFKAFMTKLLSAEGFNIASKAVYLQHEHEHILCNARILTDVRPVYGPNPEDPPLATVISHTLKVSYHEAGDLKEFYVAINASDINDLRGLLDRAEKKANSLRAVLKKADLPLVDSD